MNSERDDNSGQTAWESSDLALAIAAGQREVEQIFASRYLPKIRTMLRARLRFADVVDDLAQEVMIAAICVLRRGQLRDPAKLTPFVLAIARNVLANHYRGAARQPESLEFPDNLPDLRQGEIHGEEQERESQAMSAIACLQPVDNAILRLTLVEGLKPRFIAKRLGLSSDVVRQRKLRATRQVVEFVGALSQNRLPHHSIAGSKP